MAKETSSETLHIADTPHKMNDHHSNVVVIIIIIIGTTALFQPRPSLEASASCPYSLPHSSSFSTPSSWHSPSRCLPILVLAFPFAFFLLLCYKNSSYRALLLQSNYVSCPFLAVNFYICYYIISFILYI